MTEQEWLARTKPTSMLRFLRGKASDRKLRLFAVACCGRSCDCLPKKWRGKTVGVAEREADGVASQDALVLAEREARAAMPSFDRPVEQVALAGAIGVVMAKATDAARVACDWAGKLRLVLAYEQQPPTVRKRKVLAGWDAEAVVLLRCLFGNPFRPVAFDPAWRTPDVLRLAESIYAQRAFDRLPVLADLLEEAGATDAQLLAHLRGAGPHYRGCFALDAVLGKE
jgi:hypothetical protein